jgi:sensor histidine kinase YesM
MESYPFIFSNKLKYRLLRHFSFWACWWLFSTFLYSYVVAYQYLPDYNRLPIAATEAFIYLINHIFISYTLVYFVVPHLLIKGRYVASVVAVVALILATGFINAIISTYFLDMWRNYLLAHIFGLHYVAEGVALHNKFYLSLLAGLRGGITVGGMAASIKLMKYWYEKEQRNQQLLKENAAAQLQLLKAQVHPHFLFNTLNNIYSFTQTTSPVAAKMVLGLSDLLRYMLYAGTQSKVPLHKELKMIEDYMALEQVRYGHQLDMHVTLPKEPNNLVIAPLLLLPLVENCFKHGTSKVLEQPWISLQVTVEKKLMTVKLVNGKALENDKKENAGIGLANVQKRLELLYTERHQLKITDEEEMFIVDLKITLDVEVSTKEVMVKNTLVHA